MKTKCHTFIRNFNCVLWSQCTSDVHKHDQ